MSACRSGSAHEKARTIVIVDDDAAVCASMRFLLEAHDFDVQTYQTGEDFFQADPRTACLIVDYHMPGLDGLELVSAMRRRSRCISEIIMITATSDPCIERRASELGIRRVFRKPLSDDVLLTAVRVSLRTG